MSFTTPNSQQQILPCNAPQHRRAFQYNSLIQFRRAIDISTYARMSNRDYING
ncbi:hypothetical protein G8770_16790 [Aestuariicella hydrocarbonica]|uniref:Uncharacterized protein n=1 Tax=Pseudomaricurvus hydrocarbonicus TaxID=1470433 RepID=A0A9E5MMZ4_9GAMM|nr:hypothetical protein [Aestuariicella hydrocarbonica]NHO67207.1 hypothetical protein [Aestuariicella hydrocarbonica]